jgi:hypothetical protein
MFYERRHHRLAPIPVFLRRLLVSVGVSGAMILGTLLLGMLGYHWVAGFEWIDALHNASMILGGMGPVHELKTDAGKLFASAYALFSGVFFLAVVGVLLAPIAHRFLHQLHLDLADDDERRGKDRHAGG